MPDKCEYILLPHPFKSTNECTITQDHTTKKIAITMDIKM